MSLNSHVIVLPRREENLIAIVKCDSQGTNNDAMKKIMRAVTSWVANTEHGNQAWFRSVKDFNIGDLHGIIMYPNGDEYKSLAPYLTTEGIYNLEIDILGTGDYSSDYVYDTVLVMPG